MIPSFIIISFWYIEAYFYFQRGNFLKDFCWYIYFDEVYTVVDRRNTKGRPFFDKNDFAARVLFFKRFKGLLIRILRISALMAQLLGGGAASLKSSRKDKKVHKTICTSIFKNSFYKVCKLVPHRNYSLVSITRPKMLPL